MYDYCKENKENCMALWFLSTLFMATFYLWSIRFTRSLSNLRAYYWCRKTLITIIISNFIEALAVQSLGYLYLLGLFFYKYTAILFAISIIAHHCHFISNILRVNRLIVSRICELGLCDTYLIYIALRKRLTWKWSFRVILAYTTLCSVILFSY
ncbi:unnamed protein product [Blepharisma stoltei]|uniref:Uncharacterized protein n=1 Tax=Blepharisma stoltei TaxID=1481888 RepID=A0AAU9KJV2_9CILI|nr:unnamed protein product [Blepharisma stoltei]